VKGVMVGVYGRGRSGDSYDRGRSNDKGGDSYDRGGRHNPITNPINTNNTNNTNNIDNDCWSCNDRQSIGLDTLIYHGIGLKEYFEYFLESTSFFKGTKCALVKKSVLLQQILPERIDELLSRLTSNFFTSREADSLNKAAVLKKISFFILSHEFEAFSAHLPSIIPIINELIEYPKPVKREIYTLISVIFFKFHHNNLSALFPIYFSEVENDTLLECLRSLEMLMLIGSKETVEFRWYISCTGDENTLFKRMLGELYRDTAVRPYLDRLPDTRVPLLGMIRRRFCVVLRVIMRCLMRECGLLMRDWFRVG
ncbi:Dopey, predicted leucine zipper transcription factor, partial [Trachipleistophora hominis]